MPTSRISTPRSSRPATRAPRRRSAPNSTKLASSRRRRNPSARPVRHDAVPLGLSRSTVAEQLVGVLQRRPRRGLGERRQVVGQPHELQRVDHGGSARQVAQPAARAGERLGHGAGDDQLAAVRGEQRSALRAGAANSAYASSTTTMPGAARDHGRETVERQRRAGRVVRAWSGTDVRGGARAIAARRPRRGRWRSRRAAGPAIHSCRCRRR